MVRICPGHDVLMAKRPSAGFPCSSIPSGSRITGIIPKNFELSRNINNIKKILTKLKKSINIKILYGGSVNPKNAKELAQINEIKGFIIGGASLSAKKFIDIIKKTIN